MNLVKLDNFHVLSPHWWRIPGINTLIMNTICRTMFSTVDFYVVFFPYMSSFHAASWERVANEEMWQARYCCYFFYYYFIFRTKPNTFFPLWSACSLWRADKVLCHRAHKSVRHLFKSAVVWQSSFIYMSILFGGGVCMNHSSGVVRLRVWICVAHPSSTQP